MDLRGLVLDVLFNYSESSLVFLTESFLLSNVLNLRTV
uniref:Uncharacterized protein n=1 Tax=Lepeophtheirus salmonis TaxID=72036 RepID=A0A0K2TIY6_LEPSM